MNKTQQILKKREKEFNEKFGSINGDYFRDFDTPTKVKAHIATTISLLLNSLQEDIRSRRQSEDKYSKRHNHQVLWTDIGYNKALSDISTLLSETISNIQTK